MQQARILIADDYLPGREGLADLLRDEGLVVETSGRADLTVRRLEHAAPHVVLLGMGRPDFSSLDLITQVREVAPQCPLISMASASDVKFARAALAAGAFAYLPMPLHFPHLLFTLGLSRAHPSMGTLVAKGRRLTRAGRPEPANTQEI